MGIDFLSLTTTPIVLLDKGKPVSQGTGFYYVADENGQPGSQFVCLVTNYHVLTGHPPTEQGSPKGDTIVFYFHKSADRPSEYKESRIPLFTATGEPVWLASSSFPEADVAVIPLPAPAYEGCDVHCLSQHWAETKMLIKPTTPVSLIGYPYRFYDTWNALPIWKTGTIASEPSVNFENKPLLLVDVSAFPGMSGSPVLAVANGMYEIEEGVSTAGGARRLLGIYASMQMVTKEKYLEELGHAGPNALVHGIRDMESLQIGHVWKADLLLDIVGNVNLDEYSVCRGSYRVEPASLV